MSNLICSRPPITSNAIALPAPRVGEVTIRKAILEGADFMFIDELQKKHSHMVGFSPKDQLRKNIAGGKVLVAQDPATTLRIGYCIFNDKYFKREDLGIVYQLNIVPDKQRGLVGAALVKAAFEACPWGVKLFCCWCAQDLAANHFWESIGFVPIAFRAGSRGKEHGGKRAGGSRMQIMWQRRIREGDLETPYWYPTETTGGAMKENRIVLPIPMDKHWSDELPFVLPGGPPGGTSGGDDANALALPMKDEAAKPRRTRSIKAARLGTIATPAPTARPKRGLWFVPPTAPTAAATSPASPTATPSSTEAGDAKALAVKPKRQKRRNDPKHIAFARELRDRYLDEANSGAGGWLLDSHGKYDVSRRLAASPLVTHIAPLRTMIEERPLLDAA